MTPEIEEEISREIDKINNKLESEMIKIRDFHCSKLDEDGNIRNVINTSMLATFDYKKCLDNFLIELKSLKEKYKDYLDNE